jgi:hypothetical protein
MDTRVTPSVYSQKPDSFLRLIVGRAGDYVNTHCTDPVGTASV